MPTPGLFVFNKQETVTREDLDSVIKVANQKVKKMVTEHALGELRPIEIDLQKVREGLAKKYSNKEVYEKLIGYASKVASK